MFTDDLYVFCTKNHAKRGHRYGQHFRVTGIFISRDYGTIIRVQWANGQKGHVRRGEFCTIQQWWEEHYEPCQTTDTVARTDT